jgi:hypothetical protein
MKRIVREDKRASWDAAAKFFQGSLRGTHARAFDPAYHEQNRNRRGRVGKVAESVTLGQEAKKARAYIKQVQNRVGWARAGWNMGIVGLGGSGSGEQTVGALQQRKHITVELDNLRRRRRGQPGAGQRR